MPLTCEDASFEVVSVAENKAPFWWSRVEEADRACRGGAAAPVRGPHGADGRVGRVLPSSTATGWRDRAGVLVHFAITIVLGAANLSKAEQLQLHQRPLFGSVASDSTVQRTLAALDEATLVKIAKGRARMRRHVWSLLRLRPGGFPWLAVAGKRLTGWIVIDLDATVITAASKRARAAVTFKKTFGFHQLAAWCANTTESLAMLLRPGNAGANKVADHLAVLTEALAQIPGSSAAKILVRADGAGATHGLLEYLEALNTTRRTVRYTADWKITDDDEKAIARLPEAAWGTSTHQDGSLQEGYFVPELTGVNTRVGWPESMRLIVRRVRLTRQHLKKLTAFEQRTGWRCCITATNIGRMWGIAGSEHAQFLDVLHRSHAGVEDRVRTNKAMGLGNLPSASWEANRGWMLAANLAADLDAWLRLLALHDIDDLADAEPDTMRFRPYHLPTRLADHARRRWLRIERTWPWAGAFTTCWQRLTVLPAVT